MNRRLRMLAFLPKLLWLRARMKRFRPIAVYDLYGNKVTVIPGVNLEPINATIRMCLRGKS